MNKERELTGKALTGEQAADVIRYYHAGDNHRSRERGWRDKVSLGQSALHTTMMRHSIQPGGEPLLTLAEMDSGLKYIDTTSVYDQLTLDF